MPDTTNSTMENGSGAEAVLENARHELMVLLGNMFTLDDEDMAGYDACYTDVFKDGINFSFMSATFFAQYAAEILVGCLSSNPFRKFLMGAIEAERGRTEPGEYWQADMPNLRFGRADYGDYSADIADVINMMNTSYTKIMALNNWYGTENGKEEFDMYCLSRRAVKDIKAVICQLPYLIRHYDYDAKFAKEIMEYAGIVAQQIEKS